MAKNLAGSATRLSRAAAHGPAVAGITVAPLLADVLRRIPPGGSPADRTLPAPPLPYEETADAARA
jgi:hypothetical protein